MAALVNLLWLVLGAIVLLLVVASVAGAGRGAPRRRQRPASGAGRAALVPARVAGPLDHLD